MPLIRRAANVFRVLRHRQEMEKDLDAELRAVFEILVERNLDRGQTQEEARRAARLELAGMDQVKERVRAEYFGIMLESVLRDFRHGWRALRRSPGFSMLVVLILGIGVGAANVIFSVTDAVLLRPFPFARQERLAVVWGSSRARNMPRIEVSLRDYAQWRAYSHAWRDLAVVTAKEENLALTGGERPLNVRGAAVSANFFSLLGTRPRLGRGFLPGEDRPDAQHSVVLSEELWRRRFGADPRVLGRAIALQGDGFVVVGVMPAGFRFPEGVDLWFTIADLAEEPSWQNVRVFKAVGRLAPGVSLEEARRDMDALSLRLQREQPARYQDYRARVTPLVDEIVGDARLALQLLVVAAGLLLLIACANASGLVLARAAAQERETAVRTALGATRSRLARKLLTESLLLGAAAAALGLLLAAAGLRVLPLLGRVDIPRLDEVALDGRALAAALIAAFGTAVLSGLAPAFGAGRSGLAGALKEGGTSSAAARGSRLRRLLVVTQVTLAFMVLVSAGLVVRSLLNLQRTDLGFQPRGLLTLRLTLNGVRYREPVRWGEFFETVVRRAGSVPGVRRAGAVLLRPLSGPVGWDYTFLAEGQLLDKARTNPMANYEAVSPGYFATMGIRLLEGRDFTWDDREGSLAAAIVSSSIARRCWPGTSALGKRLRVFGFRSQPWLTVVGVVADSRYRDIREVRPDIYAPFLQAPHWAMDLVVATASRPLALAPAIERTIQSIDRDQPVSGVTTMEQAVSDEVAGARLRAFLLTVFAVLALLLAAFGIYGTVAYSVIQRRHEISIRVAMGAGRGAIVGLVLRQGLRLTAAGLALGLVGAVVAFNLAAPLLAGLLFGIGVGDLPTFALAPVVLLAAALLASVGPAGRAAHLNPLSVLRSE